MMKMMAMIKTMEMTKIMMKTNQTSENKLKKFLSNSIKTKMVKFLREKLTLSSEISTILSTKVIQLNMVKLEKNMVLTEQEFTTSSNKPELMLETITTKLLLNQETSTIMFPEAIEPFKELLMNR